MMEVKSLGGTDLHDIVRAFMAAFADYAVSFSEQEIYSILRRRGFDASLSFAAFEHGRIVGFTLNGVGHFDGLLSAYDTGTGVIKDCRGQGLATQIFRHSLPFLKNRGIEQYVLEVMADNSPALSVYRELGFEVVRTLDCFRNENPELPVANTSTCTVEKCNVQTIQSCSAFHDFRASWQNDFASLERAGNDLTCLAAKQQDKIVGYCVFDPTTGDLSNIAVKPDFRRQGIGSTLLQKMYSLNKAVIVKCLNVDHHCSDLRNFLEINDFGQFCQQYEMILKL